MGSGASVSRALRRCFCRAAALAAVALALAVAAGCGGDDDDDAPTPPATATLPSSAATAPAATATAAQPTTAPAAPTAVPPIPTEEPAATPTPPPPAATATAVPVVAQEFTIAMQLDAIPEGSNYIQLERAVWRAFGGTDEHAGIDGVALIYQDTGVESCFQPSTSVVITITRADGETEEMGHDIAAPSTIETGDGYLIPATTSLNCRNAGQPDSTTISLSIYRGGAPDLDDTVPGGLSYEFLTGGPVTDLPPVAVILTLQRVVLPAGESLPAMTGLHALVFVEDGGLNLRPATGGEVVTRALNSSSSEIPAGGETDLLAGDGVMLPLTSTAELRNVSPSPTTVLIATIQPVP